MTFTKSMNIKKFWDYSIDFIYDSKRLKMINVTHLIFSSINIQNEWGQNRNKVDWFLKEI